MTILSTEPTRVRRDQAAVGTAFLEALGRRDFAAIEHLLAPDVTFRALVPPRVLEGHTAEVVTGHLRRWFGRADRFALLDSGLGEIGGVLHMRWRARTVEADGVAREVEQMTFARVTDRIVALDLLCSGFHEVVDDER